jgi:excisionase family DNA binding protein
MAEPVEILTVEQVAALLQVSPDLVTRLLAAGELRGRRVGTKLWRTTDRDVFAYMDDGQDRPAAREPVRQRRSAPRPETGEAETFAQRLLAKRGTGR